MKIGYTDRTEETLLVSGVNAKWLEGHTLDDILAYSINVNKHKNQNVLDELNDTNGKLTYKGFFIGGTSPNSNINQITKLNIVAPKELRISIEETYDFNLPDVNVLKFIPGPTNIVHSICDFNNSDRTDFEENKNMIFDGTMKPKTLYEFDLVKEEELLKTTIDKANLNITKIEVK